MKVQTNIVDENQVKKSVWCMDNKRNPCVGLLKEITLPGTGKSLQELVQMPRACWQFVICFSNVHKNADINPEPFRQRLTTQVWLQSCSAEINSTWSKKSLFPLFFFLLLSFIYNLLWLHSYVILVAARKYR